MPVLLAACDQVEPPKKLPEPFWTRTMTVSKDARMRFEVRTPVHFAVTDFGHNPQPPTATCWLSLEIFDVEASLGFLHLRAMGSIGPDSMQFFDVGERHFTIAYQGCDENGMRVELAEYSQVPY